MHVLQGKGVFLTGKGEEPAYPGAFAVTEPSEPHGLKATERTVMLAVIAPRP
jgi:quercetin dioxygenase-like cupin family protein